MLPLMIDPVFNVPFVLLGRSRPVESWVEGSLLWNDFGGTHADSRSLEETAASEIVQECLGLLVSLTDRELFVQALKDEMFVLRLQSESQIVFVVRFAWRPSLPFEFQTLHTQLRALSRISRSVPLSHAERLTLCRFKWLQSESDAKLRSLVHHPAVMIRKQTLPLSTVQDASNSLSNVLQSSQRVLENGTPAVKCWVIDGVRSSWLEKDKIDLFSFQQLQCALRPEGLCCMQGQSIELSKHFAEILKSVVRALTFARIDFQCAVQMPQ